ncbi:hypothetical protein CY34DRAFT_18665 [Suillus luteus UH-Slu-Lm8-n1]|uniref:Uncharacterized protein n=1 Tax=Suillus luteus UH-Slu-Lm8-n1 TaxID=930992 RepID=A0A0C9ZUI7_9AGAM|nr:hypothetical protein CY34DRAFT_18665 [Suillus luteus UH-Slu-Lm8-n1]
MGRLEPTTAIKIEDPEPDPLFYDGDSDPENPETDLEFFTHRSTAGVIAVKISPRIHWHEEDIERFLHVGFDEQLNRLAIRSGFQVELIQDIYKQVRSYKQLKKVVKAMRASALNCAQAEIEAQEKEDFGH